MTHRRQEKIILNALLRLPEGFESEDSQSKNYRRLKGTMVISFRRLEENILIGIRRPEEILIDIRLLKGIKSIGGHRSDELSLNVHIQKNKVRIDTREMIRIHPGRIIIIQ